MSRPRPIVLRAHQPVPADALVCSHFTDAAHGFVGWAEHVVNPAGDVSAWHQHPESETFVYVIRGRLTLRFGATSDDVVHAEPGELLRIPAGVAHQEITGSAADLEALVVRVGRMPETVSASPQTS